MRAPGRRASTWRAVGHAAALTVLLALGACGPKSPEGAAAGATAASAPAAGSAAHGATRSAPALSVEVVSAQPRTWDLKLVANGPILAWQDAIVGAELGGQRLVSVQVDVGDVVRKGQVMATFFAESIESDVQAARAALAEAEALAAEARANADRARKLQGTGALSPQDALRVFTAEATAQARAASAKSQWLNQQLRLRQTRVLAPDDGVVSARSATVGAVGQPGQELFRLVRQGRLQWRAEVAAADLIQVKPGQEAHLQVPGLSAPVVGHVRVASPTVDGQTRNGVAYVDLAPSALRSGVRPGMFASGWLALGQSGGATLPQTAVTLQDGYTYVFVLEGSVARRVKVKVGRREGDRVEVTQGLPVGARVVAAGVGLLNDGDTVRVVGPAAGAQ
ncbi:MAG: hypothetical protein RI907_2693 [Pseudomonadota bacterium]|jgi:RND family efflux transporter MFP subunit